MINYSTLSTIEVIINDKQYKLLLAKSEEEKEQGLKGVIELEENEGMLFDYRDNVQKECTF